MAISTKELLRLKAEIKRLRKTERELKKLVYIDTLTGLGNTRMRDLMLQKNIARFGRNKDDFCIIIADLDGLKPVNDRLGHVEGDRLIRRAGKIMLDAVRNYDTVCRIGGDEFFIVMPQASFGQGKRLMLRMMGKCKNDGISISAGTASLYERFNKEGLDIKEIAAMMISLADERMYEIKKLHHSRSKYRR